MKEWFGIILGNILLLGLMFGVGYCTGYHNQPEPEKPDTPTPIKEYIHDSVFITRDSLIYITQYLDSIKHDTIEKVYKLDDTSTLDLFYKLVSE